MNLYKQTISFLVRFLTLFIPSKKLRQKLRNCIQIESKNSTLSSYIRHSIYGKIYLPMYSKSSLQSNTEHLAYNINGEPLKTFFIRDIHCSHAPESTSKYFLWDRFNFGLDVHFYSHNCMLEIMGNPKKRYGLLIEAESIVPNDYKIFERNKGLAKEFDLIFTHSEKILDKYENARLFPSCAQFWYGTHKHGGILDSFANEKKTKNISIVSSNKIMCDLHKLRIDLAKKCKQNNFADTFGNFDGGKMIPISKSLTDYRYSIAIENYLSPYWFTEKITNCFASMTIPIYIGATKISKFFNPDGIIQVNVKNFNNIENIIKICTEEEYNNRLEAIKDNYNRVLEFQNINDYMYKKYLNEDLKT